LGYLNTPLKKTKTGIATSDAYTSSSQWQWGCGIATPAKKAGLQ